jgi:hypothetical protein
METFLALLAMIVIIWGPWSMFKFLVYGFLIITFQWHLALILYIVLYLIDKKKK